MGRGNVVKAVSWPSEYADFASHPVKTEVAQALTCGVTKTKQNKAVLINIDSVMPTDIHDEFGDGAQNAYKVIKSLTSGARFYTETTGYAYRALYRSLIAIVARAFGLSQSLKATLNVANGPNYAAYQMMRGGVAESYLTAISKMPEYDRAILEMISELNSLPTPTTGGMNKFFEYLSHMYRDDRGVGSDYYAFLPENVLDLTYDDSTKVITAVSAVNLSTLTISGLISAFTTIVDKMRSSLDMNNLMADMLNVLPSSRYDWMDKLRENSDFLRDADGDFLTRLGSGTLVLGGITPGVLESGGMRIHFTEACISVGISGYRKAWQNEVGQFVSTYKGAKEDKCYDFILVNQNAKAGFTPAGTDKISTTGFVLRSVSVMTDLGTSVVGPTYVGFGTMYSNSESTIQSTAEEGGKRLGMAYMHFTALPKLDMYDYGTSGSDDDLFWRFEDMREVANTDITADVKAINQLAYSTVHLSTEKQR